MELDGFGEALMLDGFDADGYSLLTCALHTRCISSVKLVLDGGADVNQADGCGRFPIDLACGDREACQLLIDHGLTLNQEAYEKMFNCMEDQDTAMLILDILDVGCFDANQAFPDGKKPLEHAVRCGFIETIKILLAKDACIDQVDCQGRTAAHIAADLFNDYGEPFYSIYSLLREEGANVHKKDTCGKTPSAIMCKAIQAKVGFAITHVKK